MSLVAGIGVTLIAALSPARKAAKVAPVAAMQSHIIGSTGYGSKQRIVVGFVVLGGGIGALLTADASALARAGLSEGAAGALKIAQASALRLLKAEVTNRPVLASWSALIDYLRADMAHLGIERVRILHLNSKNMLIADEVMSQGSVDEAAVYVREVIRRALELSATAIIIVHNHPSGDPAPSRQDIQLTREIAEAGRPLKIQVHDHVIVGAQGHVSLRAQGLL